MPKHYLVNRPWDTPSPHRDFAQEAADERAAEAAKATTQIYGASDDLIELRGLIEEEFSHDPGWSKDDQQDAILAFSDGTLLSLSYDGIWRITRLVAGSCGYSHTPGSETEDTNDVVVLTGDLKWCVKSEKGQYSPHIVKPKRR
jgi:hypothetical protein